MFCLILLNVVKSNLQFVQEYYKISVLNIIIMQMVPKFVQGSLIKSYRAKVYKSCKGFKFRTNILVGFRAKL